MPFRRRLEGFLTLFASLDSMFGARSAYDWTIAWCACELLGTLCSWREACPRLSL